MRKFAFSLIACFTFIQAQMPAAVSPVNLSLLQYEAVTTTLGTNPDFQDIISQGEFITEIRIQRKSVNVTEGNVYVKITTKLPSMNEEIATEGEDLLQVKGTGKGSHGRFNRKCFRNSKAYLATLLLTPSTVAGAPSIAVVSIEPFTRQHQTNVEKDIDVVEEEQTNLSAE